MNSISSCTSATLKTKDYSKNLEGRSPIFHGKTTYLASVPSANFSFQLLPS